MLHNMTSAMQLKQKVVSVLNKAQSHEDVWESGSVIPCILKFRTRWW